MLSGPTKIVTEQTHPKNPLVNSNEKNPLKAKKSERGKNKLSRPENVPKRSPGVFPVFVWCCF